MSIVELLTHSISASFFLAAVMVLRLVLRKVPKNWICLLWALAALRLLCPVTVKSPVSLVPEAAVPRLTTVIVSEYETPATLAPDPEAAPSQELREPLRLSENWVLAIWALGAAGMLLWGAAGALSLRRRLREAARREPGVWEADGIGTPFVLGLWKPRIYLPSELDPRERPWVLAHERAHIARRDHLWKLLGYLTLAVHWFHPMVWISFFLFCRDLELACDERVIRAYTLDQRKAYSEALVRCSAGNRLGTLCPLCFGEVGVAQRVKAVLGYRRPVVWAMGLGLAVCALAAVCLLTEPLAATDREPEQWMEGRKVWNLTNRALEISAEELPQYHLITNSTKIRIRVKDPEGAGTARLHREYLVYRDPEWKLYPAASGNIYQGPGPIGDVLAQIEEGQETEVWGVSAEYQEVWLNTEKGWYLPQKGDRIQTSVGTIFFTDIGVGALELEESQKVYVAPSREGKVLEVLEAGDSFSLRETEWSCGEFWLMNGRGWLQADPSCDLGDGKWGRLQVGEHPVDRGDRSATFYHLTSVSRYTLSLEGLAGCQVIVDDGSHSWLVNTWEKWNGLG